MAPKAQSTKPHEPVVQFHSPMPDGYIFVPKGDIYITRNCRETTHELGGTVFVVQSYKNNETLGIRIPKAVHDRVLRSHAETAEARAVAVRKRDEAHESEVREQLLEQYPLIPQGEVNDLLSRTLKKRSGRVGRLTSLDLDQVVELAVQAHVRHNCTNYDKLLKNGIAKQVARKNVQKEIDRVVDQWKGENRHNTTSTKQKGRRRSIRLQSKKQEPNSKKSILDPSLTRKRRKGRKKARKEKSRKRNKGKTNLPLRLADR